MLATSAVANGSGRSRESFVSEYKDSHRRVMMYLFLGMGRFHASFSNDEWKDKTRS